MKAIMDYMHLALTMAKLARDKDEVPVGAVLTEGNTIIAKAHNTCKTNNHSLQHAEILVIQAGLQSLKIPYLEECTLYVTLEPCPMCAAAIAQARVGKIIFGAYDPKSGGIEHGPQIFRHSHFQPKIIAGIMEKECSDILKGFFSKKR